ncbi:MAG: GFA family protein [Erythrobacter sp.]
MRGSCNCGEVSITLSAKPAYINLCNCSLCAKSGGAWGYYSSSEVDVSGKTSSYRRADYKKPAVEMQFCANCGATTHWELTKNFEGDRVGVNMRIFEPAELTGIEAHTLDGRNWFGEGEPANLRPVGILGQNVFL